MCLKMYLLSRYVIFFFWYANKHTYALNIFRSLGYQDLGNFSIEQIFARQKLKRETNSGYEKSPSQPVNYI